MPKIITRKLELFGHICRMENDRKIKSVVFGRLEGTNKSGRPHKIWMDNLNIYFSRLIPQVAENAAARALSEAKPLAWRRPTKAYAEGLQEGEVPREGGQGKAGE